MVLTFSTLGAGLRGPRDGEEARGVVRGVLDIGGQHVEAVDFGQQSARRWRRRTCRPLRRFRGPSRPVSTAIDGLELVLGDELAALAERDGQRLHRLDFAECGARQAEQVHFDAQEVLAGDEQAALGQEVVDVGDAAIERVFDRHDAVLGLTALHGGDGILEGDAGERLVMGEKRVRAAAWLKAPGSPWNAIFLVMIRRPSSKGAALMPPCRAAKCNRAAKIGRPILSQRREPRCAADGDRLSSARVGTGA